MEGEERRGWDGKEGVSKRREGVKGRREEVKRGRQRGKEGGREGGREGVKEERCMHIKLIIRTRTFEQFNDHLATGKWKSVLNICSSGHGVFACTVYFH